MRWCAVALLLVLGPACADSNFTSNDEDVRRLALLKADGMYDYLSRRTTCRDALARYIPSNGLPLDFPGVAPNRITCPLPNGETAALLSTAEASGWTPAVSINTFEFGKGLDGTWVSMVLRTGAQGLEVVLTAPEHGRDGHRPGAPETAAGRACLAAVRAKAPPTESCSLAR